jgi:hypothetical protein
MVATVFPNGYKHAKASLPHQQVAQTHRQQVKEMLPHRMVAYSPDLARAVGGVTIASFLSQLLFLSDKGHDPDGWVYKSEAEMGKETGLTKREQQTARRKLLALGVITIMRGGFRNTYHFKVLWAKLSQVIAGIKQPQSVPTEKSEPVQTVATAPAQNVSTASPEWQQNVSAKWKQTAATPDTHRENNTESKEEENTDREHESVWQQIREKVQEGLPIGESAAQLSGTTLIAVTDTKAVIFAANRFAVPWLERRLYGQIQQAMKRVLGRDVDLQFVTSPR